VEPSATNNASNVQFLRGQDLPAASGGLTITTGSTDFLAPDGASGSITKYVGGAASGSNQYAYYSSNFPNVSASGVYTLSMFVKAGAVNPLNFCALQMFNYTGASGTSISYFSLASGTALTSGATIQNYGNGWYRCISAPFTIAAGDLTGNVLFNLAEGNNDITWPASGALNLTAYAWGAQIEAGSVATSYIPTATGSITRNTDVLTLSGPVSGCIGQTEGTLYAEVDIRLISGQRVLLDINDGGATNRVLIRINSNSIEGFVQGSTIVAYTAPSAGIYKIAFAYKSADFSLFVNGVERQTSANVISFSGMNQIFLGATFSALTPFNDRIRSAALYTTRLTNAELASLTA